MIKRFIEYFVLPIVQPFYGGGKGGGGGGGTQTVVNEPWSGAKPYINDLMSEAQNLYNANGPDYFPNATYVPFSPQSEMAMTLAQNRALMGSPLIGAGKDLTQQTLEGDFLNSNPYMDQMYDNAASAVTRNYREAIAPSIDSKFSSAGRYGSDLWANQHDQAQENLSRGLERMAGDMYGKNYAIERQNQQSILPFSQQLAQSDYNEIGQLANIGSAIEGKAGEMLNDNINRFNYYQNLPQQKLQAYSNIINGASAGTGQQTADSGGGSNVGNIIGGAATGAGLASYLSGAGSSLFGGTPTIAGLGSMGTMGLYGLGGAVLGGLLG